MWTSHLQKQHNLTPHSFLHVEVKYNGAKIRILVPQADRCPIGGCMVPYTPWAKMASHLRNCHNGPLPTAFQTLLRDGTLFWFRPRYDTAVGG